MNSEHEHDGADDEQQRGKEKSLPATIGFGFALRPDRAVPQGFLAIGRAQSGTAIPRSAQGHSWIWLITLAEAEGKSCTCGNNEDHELL
mmetsp:Transcript_28823/g.77577  ORF Transcript_28823/g.77577 Transcript_28823/m.77577 type:complete len:89 (+) Transcript_28823:134-400(+)|eukprot:CAMPEP_0185178882 /NCGR_PEP_ID=MMETSP1139-20130426/31732_1 /TAXON_ID=298111 /ORGANISM="Pavlova sp., Strain CCMP459" /LENGTH=88 /DNA_ID=CAMNT_0027744715 /DNA_START=1545 /DNA_END=1811 /DNA_ORIENTATION=+